ncbi:MAG TPA: LuxR C-terminal-related transcriptional regulator [Chthoniobacterales bacterium]|nr:LuxR C-terminal-related transcriptional regulator [Chthoniobacterales bacterium]
MVTQSSAYKRRSAQHGAARAIVVVSPHGSVQFATHRATVWLKRIFGLTAPVRRLPHPLTRWLNDSAGNVQAMPFVARDGATRIRIHLLHSEGNSLCLVLEKTSHRTPARPAHGRPLTPREAEVLSWVARGKSNAEIATILQVCTKTVDKHLERIYPKLGVENRTAAASHAESAATS